MARLPLSAQGAGTGEGLPRRAAANEFTGGCAAQYKLRHCIGDLSCCLLDYVFQIQRSYFETSHAKGERDAAGAKVKENARQAVPRKTAVIRNAKDMTDFLTERKRNRQQKRRM